MAIVENPWSPQDTLNIKRIAGTDLSPDGKRLAFTVMQAVMTSEKSSYLFQIHLASSGERSSRQLTTGEISCLAPQWSPDGRSIAYLSGNNIWLIPMASEKPQQVTAVPAGVSSFKWSPDGSMIAFTAMNSPIPGENRDAQEKNGPRIVDLENRNRRLFLVSLAETSQGPVQGQPLTGSDINLGSPEVPEAYAWSPDCTTIVFNHSCSPRPNDWPSTRLARLSLKDGTIQPIGPADEVIWNPILSPDGKWLACKIYDRPAWEWSSVVHVLPIEGGSTHSLSDTHDRRPDILGWSADAKWVYYTETCGTRQRLCALPVDGSSPVVLFEPEGCIENISLNGNRNTLGFTLQSPSDPLEAFITPLDKIDPIQMSQLNTGLRQIPLGRTEVIRWKSVDGMEIEGLLTYPVGYERNKRYPLLVSVHGGPADAWRQFFIGMQGFYGPIASFASRGYAILRCNVRGSNGYGKAFRRGNYRDWGGKDVQDMLTGVDHVINLGVADPDRMGITGWSYGGYLTAATLTQTGRFRAAAIGAGMTNLVSYAMGNDSPDYLPSQFSGEVWEVKDLLLDRSPIAHADRVTTPTLFLHGENDQRVPIWQSYELHNALKRRDVPTQMVVYPRTGHVPSEPKLLLDIMNRILAWMELYLKGNHVMRQPSDRPERK
jgi:dipeptidyl aminopeptidase/acylaminoacyl peptidase